MNNPQDKVLEAYNRLPIGVKVAISVSEIMSLVGFGMLLNGAQDGLLTFSIGLGLTAMGVAVIVDEMIKGE